MDNGFIKFRIAAATSDGIVVNQHFGRADTFRIYDIAQDNTIRFTEERKVVPLCESGNHDAVKMQERSKDFADCKYVLVSRIGQGAANVLEQDGIIPMELPGIIEESVDRLIAYDEVQALLL